MHLRSVRLEGFKRVDGLWEVEAHLLDTKDQDYPLSSGLIRTGEPVHEMSVRITLDGQFTILEAVVCTDAAPYMGACEAIAPDYSQIVGLNLFRGFLKTVKERFGGVHGCAHLTELLMFLPTAALQTFASEMVESDESLRKPYPLDRCHALESHSEVVKRYYPRWYRQKPVEQRPSSDLSPSPREELA
jgi:hypothetical protein